MIMGGERQLLRGSYECGFGKEWFCWTFHNNIMMIMIIMKMVIIIVIAIKITRASVDVCGEKAERPKAGPTDGKTYCLLRRIFSRNSQILPLLFSNIFSSPSPLFLLHSEKIVKFVVS